MLFWSKNLLFLISFLTIFPVLSWSAMVHVGSSATGDGLGGNWDNQAAWSSLTFTRGNEYYLADGTYAGKTLNTAVSTTSYIKICKATVSTVSTVPDGCSTAHGSDTGWSSTYGDGQATFSSGFSITTSYWIFDGQRGPVRSKTASDYGFSFGTTLDSVCLLSGAGTISNVTLAHLYAKATTSDVEKVFIQGSTQQSNSITVSHCLLDGWQNGIMTSHNGAGSWAPTTWEYNVCLTRYSSSSNHGEWLNPNAAPFTNLTVRYCWFEGYSGSSGMTGTIVANNSNNTSAKIYGNVFYNLLTGNGIISGTSAGSLINAVVHNNTFAYNQGNASDGVNRPLGDGHASGCVAYNNLFYSSPADDSGGFTRDYDWFGSIPSGREDTQTNGQTSTSFPFVSSTDLHLIISTNTGTTLASPYNKDMDGNTRGSDGLWDRGAFERASEDLAPPTVGITAPSGTVNCTADPISVMLEAPTNENANCSHSATPGVAYASMAAFSDGQGTMAHHYHESFACGASYSRYVKCADLAMPPNVMTSDSIISFTLTAYQPPDTDPPYRTNTTPSSFVGGTSPVTVSLSLTTDEDATCKYCQQGTGCGEATAYDSMTLTMDGAGTTSHSKSIALAAPSSWLYYVSCADVVLNKNPTPLGISFATSLIDPTDKIEAESGALVADITAVADGTASGGYYIKTSVGESGTATYTFTATAGTYRLKARTFAASAAQDSLHFVIDSDSSDVWDFNPGEVPANYGVWKEVYLNKRGSGSAQSPEFVPYTFSLSAGNHTIVFSGREVNSYLDYWYLESASTMPIMSSPLPSGSKDCTTGSTRDETLQLTTDIAATCKYGPDNVVYASLPSTFETTGGTTHTQSLSLYCGRNYTYYAHCTAAGNNTLNPATFSFSIVPQPPVLQGAQITGGGVVK